MVAVERPVGLGMERPQSVGASQFEVAEAPVRIGLKQERVEDVTPTSHDLASNRGALEGNRKRAIQQQIVRHVLLPYLTGS